MILDFELHKRLGKDSFFVTDLPLCQVRLINNQDYIWFILIPRINNIVHLTDLTDDQQIIVMQEINQVAKISQNYFTPTRLNIAAIGNIVSQMHWHVIVRYDTDKAWPNPVWGVPALPYQDQAHQSIIDIFNNALS